MKDGENVAATAPARILAGAAAVVASITLSGWIVGIGSWTRFVTPSVATRPLTGGLVLLIAVVVLARTYRSRAAARASNIANGIALTITVWCVLMQLADGALPGVAALDPLGVRRMASGTIACLLLLTCALATRGGGPIAAAIRQVFSVTPMLIGFFVTVGFMFGATAIDGSPHFTPMGLPSAIAVVLLGGAVAALSPNDAPTSVLFHRSTARRVAWTLIGSVVVVQLVFGTLRLQGERARLYTSELGVALAITYSIAVLYVMTLVSTTRIATAEQAADAARRRLQALVAAQEGVTAAVSDGEATEGAIVTHAARIVDADAVSLVTIGAGGGRRAQWRRSESFEGELPSHERVSALVASVSQREPKRCDRADAGTIQALHVHQSAHSTHVLLFYRHAGGDFSAPERDAMAIFAETSGFALEQARRFAVHEAAGIERQAEIAALHSRFRAFMENVPAAAFIKDASGAYLYGNEALPSFVGAPDTDAILGRTDEEILDAAHLARLEAAEAVSAARAGGDVRRFTDPRDRSWLLARFPIRAGTSGSFTGGIAFETTRERRAEQALEALAGTLERRVAERTEQLARANAELEAFSYSVSHDLRAPLRAISGYANILQEDYGDVLDAEGQRFLRTITSEGARMGRLIDDLLAFSRLERQSLSFATVDMTQLATETFERIRAERPDREVRFECGNLPAAYGDRSLLRQVLTNLFSNALKYAKPYGIVQISIDGERKPDTSVYRVRDWGVGFDMAYADKLFGVFQRLHRADEFEGTGVGLAIVQRIVARHGGHISGEGAVGEGATFSFTLPHPPAMDVETVEHPSERESVTT